MTAPGPASPAGASRDADRQLMRRALALAERGWGQTAPNPMVGAVVAAGGAIVGEGAHERFGEAHAEVNALRQAGDRARGASLVVTLEPCAHHGKTPPCVDAILAAGIARVVVAVRDPSEIARGGVERLRGAGVQVELGVERDAAIELNAPFLHAVGSDRPWVTLKLALSADGAVADPGGLPRWITGVESRAEVHRLRANSDAVATGIGTVLADDPELTVRDAPRPRVAPRRVVFDSLARTPVGSRLVRHVGEIPVTVVASGRAPAERVSELRAAGVDVIVLDDSSVSLSEALRALRTRGVCALFVEGGPRLAGALLRESLVDRLTIFRSPLVIGQGAPKAFDFAPAGFEASLPGRRIVTERRFGADLMTTYALQEVACSPD